MKNYQSIIENQWVELLPVNLTDEDKMLLLSKNEEDLTAQKALIQAIKSQSQISVSSEIVNTLNEVYSNVKPTLQSGDLYEFISLNLTEKVNNTFTGILNCRVNKEHLQIRF